MLCHVANRVDVWDRRLLVGNGYLAVMRVALDARMSRAEAAREVTSTLQKPASADRRWLVSEWRLKLDPVVGRSTSTSGNGEQAEKGGVQVGGANW